MIKRLAHAFLAWYCHPEYYPDIAGDLEELYHRTQQHSPRWAPWRYLLQVVGLFRPSLMKEFGQNSIITRSMFRNYLKVSGRYFAKNRLFTAINVVGLALGLAAFLLMQAYIRFERSYDSHYTQSEDLWRVSVHFKGDGGLVVKDAMCYHPSARAFREDFSEVAGATAVRTMPKVAIRQQGVPVMQEGLLWADSSFLYLFDYGVIYGDRAKMLDEPNEVVLTESVAKAYFGDKNPVGETLEVTGYGNLQLKVSGVIVDPPSSTHLKFQLLISDPTFERRADYNNWSYNNHYVFFRLNEGVEPEAMQPRFEELQRKHHQPEGELEEEWVMKRVEDIHLTSDYTYEAEAPGNLQSVKVLQIIALFILLVAWVNYINLTTARAVDRAKEVGLRKVVGAIKAQLVVQFFVDALLVNALATVLAMLIIEGVLPGYHVLLGETLINHVWNNPLLLSELGLFFLLGTFITGLYPSMVLSSFTPASVLKGAFKFSRRGILLRKTLVTVQFATSLVLIAGTLLVFRQINYMQGQDLGMNVEYVVGMQRPNFSRGEDMEAEMLRMQGLKDKFRQHAAIESVGAIVNLPGSAAGEVSSTTTPVKIVGNEPIRTTTYIQSMDDGLVDAMDMEMLVGRNFDLSKFVDTASCIANESFVAQFNLSDPASIVGEFIQFGEDDEDIYQVVGIMKDWHRLSLKQAVEPTLYFMEEHPRYLAVELNPAQYQAGLDFIQEQWAELYPNDPLEIQFLDDRFASLYQADVRFGKVVGLFAGIAIFIASLGLLGLAALIAVQRTKEVGVRKVMGASMLQILTIFYREFIILMGVSCLIGIPVYYLGLNSWLQNFNYRIDFPWHFIGVALAIVAFFVLSVVSVQTLSVARQKPSATLRYE